MARLKIRWTLKAIGQLEEIGACIALENPDAAKALITRVFESLERLERFPRSGRKIAEYPTLPHREIVTPPCRVFYRIEEGTVWAVHVTRSERILRRSNLAH